MIEKQVKNKTSVGGKEVAMKSWKCGWCKSEYSQWNASKALAHVNKLTGYNIKPCPASIRPS